MKNVLQYGKGDNNMVDEVKEEFIQKRYKWYLNMCGFNEADSMWYAEADWYVEVEIA